LKHKRGIVDMLGLAEEAGKVSKEIYKLDPRGIDSSIRNVESMLVSKADYWETLTEF
jgi:hypothetical protein